jgi:SAM-dependent methyltransferase
VEGTRVGETVSVRSDATADTPVQRPEAASFGQRAHGSAERLSRLLRNATLDFRYGGQWLGGAEPTKYAHLGAYDVHNSDYGVLDQIHWSIAAGDVLVDLGCGRGRVLNWWLRHFPGNPIVGIELDPEIAARTRRRLSDFKSVTVLTGNAPDVLARLERADVIYMHNPFGPAIMAEVERHARAKGSRVFYHNPIHLDCWAGWTVVEHTLRAPWGTTTVAEIGGERTVPL